MPVLRDTTLIVGGAGAIGSMFCSLAKKRFVGDVVSLDINSRSKRQVAGVDYQTGDITRGEFDSLIDSASKIFLAVPTDVAITAARKLSPRLKANQCLIDTLSVKSAYVALLESLKPEHEALSINPMFAPDLGFNGRSVAVVSVNHGDISQEVIDAMLQSGANLVNLTAEDHDRSTAAIQVATHAAILAFAMTLQQMEYDPSKNAELWSPPHTLLLSLAARILGSEPEVYRDIQVGNPFAILVRQTLKQSCLNLDQLVVANDPDQFVELFKSLHRFLGPKTHELEEICRSSFQYLNEKQKS